MLESLDLLVQVVNQERSNDLSRGAKLQEGESCQPSERVLESALNEMYLSGEVKRKGSSAVREVRAGAESEDELDDVSKSCLQLTGSDGEALRVLSDLRRLERVPAAEVDFRLGRLVGRGDEDGLGRRWDNSARGDWGLELGGRLDLNASRRVRGLGGCRTRASLLVLLLPLLSGRKVPPR